MRRLKLALLLLVGSAAYATTEVNQVVSGGGGSGDVVGPASSVDGQITLYNGTTGKLIKAATGTGVVHAASGVYSTATVTVAEGGTNATTASAARTNLGAAASGSNSDITSLSGLTTPLSVGQGGSGTATAFTAGSVVFAGAAGVYSQDNPNFFFDVGDSFLGVGTNAPTAHLSIVKDNPIADYDILISSVSGQFRQSLNTDDTYLDFTGDMIWRDDTGATEKMRLNTTGLSIGGFAATVPLDVAGSVIFRPAGANFMLIDADSGYNRFFTTSGIIAQANKTSGFGLLVHKASGTAADTQTPLGVASNGLISATTPIFNVFNTTSVVSAFAVLESGNVGIGTDTPGAKLTVTDTISTVNVLAGANGSGVDADIFGVARNGVQAYQEDSGTAKWAVFAGSASNTAAALYAEADGNGAAMHAVTYGTGAHITLENAAADTIGVTIPGAIASYTLTLPADDGTLDQFLQTDGAGNTTWANPAPTWESDTSAASATCSKTCSAGSAWGGGCTNTVALALQKSYQTGGNTWNCEYALATGDCTAQVSCL